MRSATWPGTVSPLAIQALLVSYLLLLLLAEVAVTFLNPLLVFPLHGGLIGIAAACLALPRKVGETRSGALGALMIALVVAPLIRVISLTLPLPLIDAPYRYLSAGIPMALGAVLAARAAGLSWGEVGVRWDQARWQTLAILSSVGLGFVEFLILRQEAIGPFPWTLQGILPALSVGIFTGFPEELIFRGVMQTATRPILGRWNWVYVSAIFAALHIGYQSYIDVLFVFTVGLFYGWIFERTRSIIGISIGHGLANVVLFFVAPNLISPEALPIVGTNGQVAVAVVATATLGVVGLLWQRGLLGGSISATSSDTPQRRRPQWPANLVTPPSGPLPLGPIRFSVRADPAATAVDVALGVVPAEQLMVPIVSHWNFQATQTEDLEGRATGTVRFESRNRARQVIIPARTSISTRSGIVFRTLDGVVLAPATIHNPAALEVVVEAEVPGPEGNVAAGAISVVNPELAELHVSVRNPAGTDGGSRVKVHRVAPGDYQAARGEAIAHALREFRRLATEEAPERGGGRHVVLDTARLEVTVAEPSAARIVGQVAESVELTLNLVATATAVELKGLREAAVAQLRGSLPVGFQLVPGSVAGRVTDATASGQMVTYTVEVSGQQVRSSATAAGPVG